MHTLCQSGMLLAAFIAFSQLLDSCGEFVDLGACLHSLECHDR